MPKPDRAFSIVPQNQEAMPFEDDLQLFDPNRALTKDEQRIVEEYHKQELVMKGSEAKAELGAELVARLNEKVIYTFDDSSGRIIECKNRVRSKEHQLLLNTFISGEMLHYMGYMSSMNKVGATAIGVEAHRSLYPAPKSPKPAKPRSLREVLFG